MGLPVCVSGTLEEANAPVKLPTTRRPVDTRSKPIDLGVAFYCRLGNS